MICEKMPRKFSKSATRFDVPMDLKSVEGNILEVMRFTLEICTEIIGNFKKY